jgi:steroid 5-alpha reductase family enzyme
MVAPELCLNFSFGDRDYIVSTLLLSSLGMAIGYVTLIWLLSLVMGRVGIIDAFWGPGFVLIAALCDWLTNNDGWNRAESWLLAMVTIWGARLGIHLSIRVFGDPHEDRRYAAMRKKYDPHFWLKSLGIVFLLQGVIMWFVALPLIAAFAMDHGSTSILLAVSGVIFWGVGLFFEAAGDYQLARFRADPLNQGVVLNSGLWALTRHPNYFGDFAVWWGLWLYSLACGAPFWTIVSPAVMSLFLIKVSGVTLLEKDITERRPGYAEYVRSTNAFFPGPRKKS